MKSYRIYLYDGFEFNRDSNKLGYLIKGADDVVECERTVTSSTRIFRSKFKAESLGDMYLKSVDSVGGYDIEDDAGVVIASNYLDKNSKEFLYLFSKLSSSGQRKLLKQMSKEPTTRVLQFLQPHEIKVIDDFKTNHDYRLVPKLLRMCIGKERNQIEEIIGVLESED